ncbi:MAG: hypothetical protein Kow0042_26850 [Calditrichia bacterium]
MLTIIYQFIILFFVILLVYDLFKEKNKAMQLTAAITLIPFVLRLLLIK